MEHYIVIMYLDYVGKVLKKKPQVFWILQAPTGPLMLWLFSKAIILEAFGNLNGWEIIACFVMGIAGIWFSLRSIAHLIAWVCYIATGLKDPSSANPPAPNPDAASESS